QASLAYWLILNDPSDSNLFWRSTAVNPTGPAAVFQGSGQGSMTSPTQVNNFNSVSGGPLLFEVDATAAATGQTPEPGALLFAPFAIGGLAAFERRRPRFTR